MNGKGMYFTAKIVGIHQSTQHVCYTFIGFHFTHISQHWHWLLFVMLCFNDKHIVTISLCFYFLVSVLITICPLVWTESMFVVITSIFRYELVPPRNRPYRLCIQSSLAYNKIDLWPSIRSVVNFRFLVSSWAAHHPR